MKSAFLGRVVALALVALFSASCAHVTANADSDKFVAGKPDHKRQVPFFWSGFGAYHLNARELCGGKPLQQIQLKDSFTDHLLTIATLGIYTPTTALIWCKGRGK